MKARVEDTYPPVGGVVQGAMVLADGLFADMSLESLQRTMRPKVDGSRNLSDVFCDLDLDFFVMLSSLTCVGGNPGQSNYTAANLVSLGRVYSAFTTCSPPPLSIRVVSPDTWLLLVYVRSGLATTQQEACGLSH